MTSARIDLADLLALLREREHTSLPYVVTAAPTADSVDILDAVRAAIAESDAAAAARRPQDPTTSSEGDAAPAGVVAELADGPMTAAEVEAWFTDLGERLDSRGLAVTVSPLPPDPRVPDFLDWLELPPQVTGLLHFTAVGGETRGGRRIPVETLNAIVPPLVAWSRLPAATVVVGRGLSESVSRADLAAAQLLDGLPVEPPELGITQVTLAPKRLRRAAFGLDAQAGLHVVDETRPAPAALPDVVDALRIVAPYLDYAGVRRAQPVLGSHSDVTMTLGRAMTEAEDLVRRRRGLHLLAEYAVDAYVAQVLTEQHLERARRLDDFEVTEQGNGRFLVVARDPDPWLTGLNPDPGVIAQARTDFGEMILTRATYDARPEAWRRTS